MVSPTISNVREGYDRLLDMESFGGKIRDTEDEFKGAEFPGRGNEADVRLRLCEPLYAARLGDAHLSRRCYHELKRLGVRIS